MQQPLHDGQLGCSVVNQPQLLAHISPAGLHRGSLRGTRFRYIELHTAGFERLEKHACVEKAICG